MINRTSNMIQYETKFLLKIILLIIILFESQ